MLAKFNHYILLTYKHARLFSPLELSIKICKILPLTKNSRLQQTLKTASTDLSKTWCQCQILIVS